MFKLSRQSLISLNVKSALNMIKLKIYAFTFESKQTPKHCIMNLNSQAYILHAD